MIIRHRAHNGKKSNKNITVLKIICNTLYFSPLSYSLGRLTYNTRVHKMADTVANPAIANLRTRERDARTVSALGAARNNIYRKFGIIIGSSGGKYPPDDSNLSLTVS